MPPTLKDLGAVATITPDQVARLNARLDRRIALFCMSEGHECDWPREPLDLSDDDCRLLWDRLKAVAFDFFDRERAAGRTVFRFVGRPKPEGEPVE